MTVPSYTEEDVELVAAALFNSDGADYHDDARSVLAALSSANRLVPPGSETEEQIGCRLWMVDDPEHPMDDWTGRTLAEIRIREHAKALEVNPAWRGRAVMISRKQITTPWSPSVPDTKEGS